jgi:hypothetical protein
LTPAAAHVVPGLAAAGRDKRAIQIQKLNNYEEHIVRAQGVRAALEVLEVSITSGNLTTRKATSQFLKCLEDCSFMEPIH